MSLITTHAIDTSSGEPAAGMTVLLEYCEGPGHSWSLLGRGQTDAAGRLQNLLTTDHSPRAGLYRLRFDTSTRSSFFPEVTIQFLVSDLQRHYHIPLLLSRFGYTTYLGAT